jgi:hypothetical protein
MSLTRAACSLAALLILPVLSGCSCGGSGATPTPTPVATPAILINQTLSVSAATTSDNTNPPQFLQPMVIGQVTSIMPVIANQPISIFVTAPGGNSANIRATVGGQIILQPASAYSSTQMVFTPSTAQYLQLTISALNASQPGQQYGIMATQ